MGKQELGTKLLRSLATCGHMAQCKPWLDMPEKPRDKHEISVVRDPSHARFYVDNGAAFVVGRDLEIAYMIGSPEISLVEVAPGRGQTEVTAESRYFELCRIRMPTRSALATSLNVLFALLEEGKVEVETLRTNIDRMIGYVSSKGESPGAD